MTTAAGLVQPDNCGHWPTQQLQVWAGHGSSGGWFVLIFTYGQLQWAVIASHSRINKPRPPGDSRMAAGMVAWRMASINRLVR